MKTTIPKMFAGLSDRVKNIFGKEVIFLVPTLSKTELREFSEGFKKEFSKIDSETSVVNQVFHFSDYQMQRDFVKEVVIKKSKIIKQKKKIIVVTNSPVTLSDAFSEQIGVWKSGHLNTVSFPTFGADPGLIAIHVLSSEETIGSFAKETLDKLLKRKWSISDKDELEDIVNSIGGGWPRVFFLMLLGNLYLILVQTKVARFFIS